MNDADGSLGARLRRCLARERLASAEQLVDIHAMPFEERVDSGHCIDGLRFLGWGEGRSTLRLTCPVNVSRFRAGDRLVLGDGGDPGAGVSVVYLAYDPVSHVLLLQKDPWLTREEEWQSLDLDGTLAVDRAHSDFGETVLDAVERVFTGGEERFRRIRAILGRTAGLVQDPEARRRAEEAVAPFGLDPSQREAFVRSVSISPFHLVQGPPGSGKTRLIASLLTALARRGHRALLTAYTHRAVNHALRSLHAIDPSIRAVKVGEGHHADDLPPGIARVRSARSVPVGARGGPPTVVGATVFALKGFWETAPFGWVVLDEAAQIPLAHALCALLCGRRYVLLGDPMQLGPILAGEHQDPLAARSIFSHLSETGPVPARASPRPPPQRVTQSLSSSTQTVNSPPSAGARETAGGRVAGVDERAPGRAYPRTLLRYTYRMNAEISSFPSGHFYAGALEPAPDVAARRLAWVPGGTLDPLWDPARAAIVASIAHEGHRTVCAAEAELAADLVADFLIRQGRCAADIAVVTPYRAQVREIRNRLAHRGPDERFSSSADGPTIDTVERMQGQEREVVVVSLVCSEPEYAASEAAFFFSPNRLNVTLTRARTKLIVIASPLLFEALPGDLAGLKGASLFAGLYRELPRIDLSDRYRPAALARPPV